MARGRLRVSVLNIVWVSSCSGSTVFECQVMVGTFMAVSSSRWDVRFVRAARVRVLPGQGKVGSVGVAAPGDRQAGTRAEALEVTAEGLFEAAQRLDVGRLRAQDQHAVADDDPAAGVTDERCPRAVGVLDEGDPCGRGARPAAWRTAPGCR